MTSAGIAFLIVGVFLSFWIALSKKSLVYVWLFAVHLAAAFFMWDYTLTRASDSWGYYNGYYSSILDRDRTLLVGTLAVEWFTLLIRDAFDASYLDMYMFFHLFGYLGLVLFHSTCQQQFFSGGSGWNGPAVLARIFVFLPSLHVWTAVVGKDSLMVLGTMSTVWGAASARRRWMAICLGMLICFFVRPHVAALLMVSCAFAVLIQGQRHLVWRMGMFAGLVALTAAATPFVLDYVGLRSVDSQSIEEYIEHRQDLNLDGGSSVDISQYSFPMQFFTYMFRPLFFDAFNALGAIVSLENLLYLTCALIWGPKIWRALRFRELDFFLKFNLFFWVLGTSLFATMTANLGLAMRQKTTFLPSFLLLIVAASSLGYGAPVKGQSDSAATTPAPPSSSLPKHPPTPIGSAHA